MTRHVRTRYATMLAASVVLALALIGAHSPADSATSSFATPDRVTVNTTGERGTVVAVPDSAHVVVALDGARAQVNSYQPDQITEVTASPSPSPSPAPFPTRTALSLGDFDQAYALNGGISESNGIYTATYNGGSNGYARGLFDYDDPKILEGQDVWMGARYELPSGFVSTAGYVSLVRRDNYGQFGSASNTCGIALWGGDSRLHAECNTYDGSWPTQNLIGGIVAPEGRWFTLELHQKLDSALGSVTEVYLDGAKVGSSTGINNLFNRATDRVRFGIVAVGPQESGYRLRFTDPYVSSVRQPFN
jgi:hypothetical protein